MQIVKKFDEVVVQHIVGETFLQHAELIGSRIDGNHYQVTCDLYLDAETCVDGFFHIRQARPVIEGKTLSNEEKAKSWPRMRKALHEQGYETICIPGGGIPLHYEDELVIPDFGMMGSHYFVIKKSDIHKILSKFPLDDKGKERRKKYENK